MLDPLTPEELSLLRHTPDDEAITYDDLCQLAVLESSSQITLGRSIDRLRTHSFVTLVGIGKYRRTVTGALAIATTDAMREQAFADVDAAALKADPSSMVYTRQHTRLTPGDCGFVRALTEKIFKSAALREKADRG